MAGPTWERLPQPVYNLKHGSVILLDMSLSMRATDIVPDRLTRARFKAIDLVNQLSDGEVGMVAYAGDAFVISPLTEDVTNLTTLIPSVSPEIMPIPGSEPITGFEVAAELLANAGYQQGQIFWFTDGIEQQQFAELANFTEQSPYTVQALAIGTPDGAPIQQVNGELLKDSSGAIVVPRLTVDNIRAISARSGGSYALMSADDTDIQVLLDNSFIDRTEELTEDEQNSTTGDKWQDMGAFLVVLLLPFAAYAFRRGIVMLVPLLLLVVMHNLLTVRPNPIGWTLLSAPVTNLDSLDMIQRIMLLRQTNSKIPCGEEQVTLETMILKRLWRRFPSWITQTPATIRVMRLRIWEN
jgi:Ca-activated chloride channel family protein